MSASRNLAKDQKSTEEIQVVALALFCTRDGKYLLARRGPAGSGAGCWEFPGGKIEVGETQQQALRREINEELSFDLAPLKLTFVAENLHPYENRNIRIFLWRAEVDVKPSFRLVDHDSAEWYSRHEIAGINLSEGDKYFISLI